MKQEALQHFTFSRGGHDMAKQSSQISLDLGQLEEVTALKQSFDEVATECQQLAEKKARLVADLESRLRDLDEVESKLVEKMGNLPEPIRDLVSVRAPTVNGTTKAKRGRVSSDGQSVTKDQKIGWSLEWLAAQPNGTATLTSFNKAFKDGLNRSPAEMKKLLEESGKVIFTGEKRAQTMSLAPPVAS